MYGTLWQTKAIDRKPATVLVNNLVPVQRYQLNNDIEGDFGHPKPFLNSKKI
jgi:hypothetical protein